MAVKTLKPTTGKAWRKGREEGYALELPSGNVALLRPVALDVLLTSGKLPDILAPMAAAHLWTENTVEPGDIAKQAELAKGYADLINAVVPAAMLSPRVVETPEEDDEIALDDLEFADKVAIFNLATSGASLLAKFRDEQAGSLASVSGRKNGGRPAKQSS